MKTEHAELVGAVFCEIMEKIAFMFGEELEPEEELPIPETGGLMFAIQFAGPSRGLLVLMCSADMCGELAANMLGIEPDDPGANEKAIDAAKELVNVTCGNLLTRVFGEDPVFNLGIPEVREVKAEAWNKLAREPDSIRLLVDDYPALLQLRIQ